MKRALLSGLLTFLALLPSNEASANYRTENGHNGRIESTIMDYTTKESISLRTVWSDEIDGVIVSNYPDTDWSTLINYDDRKKVINFQVAAPPKIHDRYIEMFKQGGKEVACYWAEMENTPLPKWKMSIKDYTNDDNPPEIDIKPDKNDLYMLLNIYKEKRREHEKSRGKIDF